MAIPSEFLDKALELVSAVEASVRRGEWVPDDVRIAAESLLAHIALEAEKDEGYRVKSKVRDERFHAGETWG